MKKTLCLLLAAVIVFSILPMSAMADGENYFMHSLVFEADGGYTEKAQILPLSFFSGIVNDTSFIKLYYGNIDSQTPLQAGELSSSDTSVIAVTRMSDDSIGVFYKLECLAAGEATLTYTEAGVSYSQTISVVDGSGEPVEPEIPAPVFPFYSQRSMDSQWQLANGKLNLDCIGSNIIWLMTSNGLTMGQINALEIIADPSGKAPALTTVLREGSTDSYDLAIELAQPDAAGAVVGGYNLSINLPGEFSANFRVCIEAEGKQMQAGEYVINFGHWDDVTQILTIHEPQNVYPHNSDKAANPDNPYVSMGEFRACAGTYITDEQGITVYQPADDVELEIVSARIETVSGDEATFSLSGSALVKSLGEGPDSESPVTHLEMYVKDGYTGYCKLLANVKVIQNDVSIACDSISLVFTADRENNVSFDYEADLASGKFSGTITEYLKYIAENYIDKETYPIRNFTVTLGDKTYTEDVIIDAGFNDNDNLTLVGGAATIIEGCIDLNSTANQKIRNINLRADSDSYNVGIFGGRCFIDSCSFYNFDIALNDTDDALHSSVNKCVFINNKIAWNINTSGSLMNIHSYNTFINNTVALNVSCTHSENSSYYFRIIESNFINNGTDFSANTGSTLYMYRNYFGEYKKVKGNTILPGKYAEEKYNGEDYLRLVEMAECKNAQISSILSRRPAVITVDSDTTVIANPRWKYPIKDWWKINNKLIGSVIYPESNELVALSLSDEEEVILDKNGEYVDILVTDWDNLTTIINDEADSLIIDASAFEEESDSKVIEVVDSNEDTLGTWTFE